MYELTFSEEAYLNYLFYLTEVEDDILSVECLMFWALMMPGMN